MKYVHRLSCTVQKFERELADLLAAIRLAVSGPGISRKLWLCSPRYALQFFSVQDAGLVKKKLGRGGASGRHITFFAVISSQ